MNSSAPCKLIAYYRVSTTKQGADGLGIAAQRTAVERHVASTGCALMAEYTEVESASKDTLKNRPELRKAIAHAKRSGATLIIARLDRLARSVYVTAELHRSGVEFIACDNPHANRMTIQILAVMAEHESRMISARTRAAMAAAKARGKQFGNPRLKPDANLRGVQAAAQANRASAQEAYTDLLDGLKQYKAQGLSFRAIADELNAQGHTTRRGKPWTHVQVARVLARA